jgi:ketosteroid isomerase-like protein
MRRVSIVLIALVAVSAMAQQQSEVVSVLQKNADQFAAAASHGNVDGMVALYDDHAILMPPNAPAMKGKEAIRQFWTGFTTMGAIDAKLTTDDIITSGELAAEMGHFDLTITPKSGTPIKDNGKYLVLWRNVGGQWKIVRDIFNSSLPR